MSFGPLFSFGTQDTSQMCLESRAIILTWGLVVTYWHCGIVVVSWLGQNKRTPPGERGGCVVLALSLCWHCVIVVDVDSSGSS